VLVLGSGGLIGRHVVAWLREQGFEVLEVRNRTDRDLRVAGALDAFAAERVSFCFFLACEVGGSKFLTSEAAQRAIVEHNVQIYQTVLPWLAARRVPFVFTSSYLQHQHTPYGAVKRLGEQWVGALGVGRVVRLWNVYGFEPLGPKSHVMGDWVAGCLRDGRLTCLTDGSEERQFLHARDCAAGLGRMMLMYDTLAPVTDISSDRWIALRDLAALVSSLSPRACAVAFDPRPSQTRERLAPNTTHAVHRHWVPRVSLAQGVRELFDEYARALAAPPPAERDL
jgi:nucleoside-diphosphate-sugar epimerase